MKKSQYILFLLILTIAVLFLTTCSKDDDPLVRKENLTNQFINDISSDSLESYVKWLEGMGTRFALADNRRTVAVEIKNRFRSMGYANARLDSFLLTRTFREITYTQWQYNVLATLQGSHYPDSVSVIGGHYDNYVYEGDPFSVVPGANDNGAGVAAALEIARVMKTNGYTPESTIEFIAFGAEELGLHGSINYVTFAGQRQKKVKLMLNNDMIAFQPGSVNTGWRVNIIDYDNSHAQRTQAEELCLQFTNLDYYNDNTHNTQSDSYPFFVAGYKAIFFTSDVFDTNYHSANDLATNCNFDYCKEITKICVAMLVYNN